MPYVDNWATCDQMSPNVLKKNSNELLNEIKKWLNSTETYTIRFGISMLMKYYLDDNFKLEYLKMVCNIKSEEYYVNMMKAWYFATSLAKQYKSTIPFIEQEKLDKLRREQENRKGYQDRQEKLRKHERNENWEHASEAVGKLVEGITQGAQLFANNDEEEEKKPKYIAGSFTKRTKAIIQAHENMSNYYGGTTSVKNQEEYLRKIKKQPMQVNALAGRYLV